MIEAKVTPIRAAYQRSLGTYGIPRRFMHETLVGDEWSRVPSVQRWFGGWVSGRVYGEEPNEMSGMGLTVVGEANDAQRLLAGLVQDVLRRKETEGLAPGSVRLLRWWPASSLYEMNRDDSVEGALSFGDLTKVALLVVTDVNPEERWETLHLEKVMRARLQMGNPTMVAVRENGLKNLSPTMKSLLQESNSLVRV